MEESKVEYTRLTRKVTYYTVLLDVHILEGAAVVAVVVMEMVALLPINADQVPSRKGSEMR